MKILRCLPMRAVGSFRAAFVALLVIIAGLFALQAHAATEPSVIGKSRFVAECTFKSGSGLLGFVENRACSTRLLAEYIVSLNEFLLRLAIVLAVLMIAIGGFQWLMAIGNSSRISNAKDTIQQAVIGLILAMTATLLFSQIDKSFTEFDPKQFNLGGVTAGDYTFCKSIVGATFIFQAKTELGEDSVTPAVTARAVEIAEAQCKAQEGRCTWKAGTCESLVGGEGGDCTDCEKIEGSYAFKNGSLAAPEMVEGLQCLSQKLNAVLRVTEAYPPSSPHRDQNHNNGCAVDVTPPEALNNSSTCPPLVPRIIAAASGCGLSVKNEDLRCGGVQTQYWTNNHVHLSKIGCL